MYTVGPQTYMVTLLGTSGSKASFFEVMVLYRLRLIASCSPTSIIPGIAQTNGTVENRSRGRVVMTICDKIALSFKLEMLLRLSLCQRRLYPGLRHYLQ